MLEAENESKEADNESGEKKSKYPKHQDVELSGHSFLRSTSSPDKTTSTTLRKSSPNCQRYNDNVNNGSVQSQSLSSSPSDALRSNVLLTESDMVRQCVTENKAATGALAEDQNCTEPKKRRIHMWGNECINYTNSEAGGTPLVNPLAVAKRSHDPYQGLQPKEPRVKSKTHSSAVKSSFVSAKMLTGAIVTGPNDGWERGNKTPTKNKPRRERNTASQSNVIGNYFKPSPPKENKVSVDDAQSDCSTPSQSPASSQETVVNTPSRMFSPVKQLEGTSIYVIEDSPEQYRQLSRTNKTIKKLFHGSKNSYSQPSSTPQPKSRTLLQPKHRTPNLHHQLPVSVNDVEFASCSFDMTDSELLACEDKYGLLGTGQFPQEPACEQNYFNLLPDDIIENIFCYLPILDLCLNTNRVCLAWNAIISNPRFLPWKKFYFKLKKGYSSAVDEINQLMKVNCMNDKISFLPGLIRYMKDHKPVTSHSMMTCLQKHPKYEWAKDLMVERFQDCFLHEEPNPWCVITVLIILSESVGDISTILQHLLSPMSQCSARIILDCMYCVATFLQAFKRRLSKEIWNGMHYRLYYALYLFENSATINCSFLESSLQGKSGQQTMMKYTKGDSVLRLTHEQLRICNYDINPGEIIKIVAFAGTGKTSTLVRYTQLRPHMRFLLVVYNKSVKEHSIKTFPPNVMCKTGHGLAYNIMGFRYKTANKLASNLNVFKVTQILPSKKGENLFVRARNVLETLKSYFASADRDIILEHTPTEKMDSHGERTPISLEHRQGYIKDADFLWTKMKDLKSKVNITHDGYLKLYQLSNPLLSDYDCILIDEAQDLTPAVSSVLLSQSQAKILVGDPHQQIYSFRGATNAMQQVQATKTFYLTQSFRFGPEIARVASCCLELLKNETKKTLVGNGNPGNILGEPIGQIAIITRTNFSLFNEAVKKCCYTETEYKVYFIGGTTGFGFDMLMEIYTLMLSPEDRKKEGLFLKPYSFISNFDSIGALEKYANETIDAELTGKIKIVRSYHNNLPMCIKGILKKCVGDQMHADIVFSTAHKAKGLEFSTVKLADDFFISPVFLANMVMVNQRLDTGDESNLLYVAVTRAKRALQMSPSLRAMLKISGESFICPVSSRKLKAAGRAFKCMSTDATFEPLALTLEKKDVVLSTGTKLPGGIISPAVVNLDRASWSGLVGELPKPNEDNLPP